MRNLLTTLSVLAVTLASLGTADAGTYLGARAGAPAFLGYGVEGSFGQSCFSPYGPSITNRCSSPDYWHIELPLSDTRVGTLVTVSFIGTNASHTSLVRCRPTVSTWDGNVTVYDYRNPTSVGVPSTVELTVSVPPGSTLGFDCELGSGSKVTSFYYR